MFQTNVNISNEMFFLENEVSLQQRYLQTRVTEFLCIRRSSNKT